MKRILVTGGAGFLGSHLCERLIRDGHYVICLDNFYTGRHKNIAHLQISNRFYVLRRNVEDPDLRTNYRMLGHVDEIYNLACPASPPHYQGDNAIQTTLTSVMGAYNMLEVARYTGAKILQASTSEVYGDPEMHPQREYYVGHVNPIGVRACYDEGKRCAESLFFDFHRTFDLDVKVIRIFNTYGPNMDPNDGRVVSNFICQALRGEDITIYGDGTQTRSFQYVDDLVEAMVRMMATPKGVTGPVNTGNPGEFTMLELAELVVKMINERNYDTACQHGWASNFQPCTSKIVFKPLPGDDPKMRKPDITLAKGLLNWEPKIPLSEGLAKTIQYFRNTLRDDNGR
jgi:UDP-glucuronate decarboxylase